MNELKQNKEITELLEILEENGLQKEKAEVSGIKSKRYDRSRRQGFLCRRSLAQQGNRPGKIQ